MCSVLLLMGWLMLMSGGIHRVDVIGVLLLIQGHITASFVLSMFPKWFQGLFLLIFLL
jgi:hypothetical protein